MYIYINDIYIYVSQLLKEKYGWVGWVIAISNDLLGSLDVIHVPPLWSDDLWCFQVRCRFKILGTDLTHLGPEVFLSSTSTLFVLGYSSWQWDLAKNRLMTWDGEGYVCHIIRCQFLGRLEITSRSCLLDLASICDCNLLLYNVRIYIYIYICRLQYMTSYCPSKEGLLHPEAFPDSLKLMVLKTLGEDACPPCHLSLPIHIGHLILVRSCIPEINLMPVWTSPLTPFVMLWDAFGAKRLMGEAIDQVLSGH